MKEVTIIVKRLVNSAECDIKVLETGRTARVSVAPFYGLARPDIQHTCRVSDDFPKGADMRIEAIGSDIDSAQKRKAVTRREAFELLRTAAGGGGWPDIPRTEMSVAPVDFECEEDIMRAYAAGVQTALFILIGKALPLPEPEPEWLSPDDALEEMARLRVPMAERVTLCSDEESAQRAVRVFCQEAATKWPDGEGQKRVYLVEKEAWKKWVLKIIRKRKKNSHLLGFSFSV